MEGKLPDKKPEPDPNGTLKGVMIVVAFLIVVLAMGSLMSWTLKGKVDQIDTSVAEAEAKFSAAHSELNLLPALNRESVTTGGLNSELAASLCLNAAEADGLEVQKEAYQLFSSTSGDDIYSVYPTKDNDAFYVRIYLTDDSEILCKGSGTAESPKTELLS